MKNSGVKNVIFSLFLAITLMACNKNSKNKQLAINYSKNNNVTQIILIYQDLNTLTFSRVLCSEMEQVFNLKKKVINSSKIINKIQLFLEKTIKQKKMMSKIDARFKMILIYNSNNKKDTICGSGFAIKINNKVYRINKDFSNLLKVLTETID